jgi:hypothetical protein
MHFYQTGFSSHTETDMGPEITEADYLTARKAFEQESASKSGKDPRVEGEPLLSASTDAEIESAIAQSLPKLRLDMADWLSGNNQAMFVLNNLSFITSFETALDKGRIALAVALLQSGSGVSADGQDALTEFSGLFLARLQALV